MLHRLLTPLTMNKKVSDTKYQTARWVFVFYIFFLSSYILHGQEFLTSFRSNPVLIQKFAEIKNNTLKKQPPVVNTVTLPFFDDFSKENIYPDAALWLDSNVFINRDYPIAPPTIGVATFDGVSKSGCPYDTSAFNNPGLSYPADVLTSRPIDLSGLPADSTVVLSFFWQAKGRGNDPEQDDSLLLDYRDPTSKAWINIWYMTGYNPTPSDTEFRLVMKPIANPIFLKDSFQFRFRNYATTSGNDDHWHIDYVLLDKFRNMGDSIFSDVAFVYNSRPLLSKYYAMPWEQYTAADMAANLSLSIRNNDSVLKNTAYVDTIYNSSGGIEASSGTPVSANIDPYPGLAQPGNVPYVVESLNGYTFPGPLTQRTTFDLECVLNTSPDKNRNNDTLRFKQNFSNYYAYDDGTAEGGYGLNYYGGEIAYKFTLNKADILYAVQMLFDWFPPKVTTREFRIRIWADNGGIPGNVIYTDSLVSPKYQYQFHSDWGNLTNTFYPYMLTSPVSLNGTFYVGWVQNTVDLLNIGLDKNTNSNSNMFYEVGAGWHNSQLKGSWMIRPVFGDTAGLMGVHELATTESAFDIFPNPSSGKFNIRSKVADGRWQMADVYNLFGEKIYSLTNTPPYSLIDLSDKPNGVYFLRITDEKGVAHSQKLVIAK